jgi:metal-responsive CopG/Arc/MetJ family transcriptional regulator
MSRISISIPDGWENHLTTIAHRRETSRSGLIIEHLKPAVEAYLEEQRAQLKKGAKMPKKNK